MRVKAIGKGGFDGSRLRRPGEVFDIPEFYLDKDGEPLKDADGKPARVFSPDWMVEVDAKEVEVTRPRENPVTPGAPGVAPAPASDAGVVEPAPAKGKPGRPKKHLT